METTVGGESRNVKEQFREQVSAVKNDLHKLGRVSREAAREIASEYLDGGKQRYDEIEDRALNYIRERPIKSVLVAAGAGLLIGYLLSSRR